MIDAAQAVGGSATCGGLAPPYLDGASGEGTEVGAPPGTSAACSGLAGASPRASAWGSTWASGLGSLGAAAVEEEEEEEEEMEVEATWSWGVGGSSAWTSGSSCVWEATGDGD